VTSAATQPDRTVSDGIQYPRHARRRFPLVLVVIAVAIAVIAAVGGFELVKRNAPTYRSSVAITLDQPLKLAASINSGEVDKLARLRAKYMGVVKFDTVVAAVAKEVNLTPGQVRTRVFAAAEPSSLLLIVGANDHTPAGARRIATALANEMIVYIQKEAVANKIPDKDRITAQIVVAAGAGTQTSPTRRKEVTSGIVTGLLAFLIIMGLGALLRRPTP
jgi:capsular polysaccharide biosynthesis protein